ncbi:DUF5791 family protein [Haloglomus salinum]|uniref:DUF5791 family protein n=1 Tax=Haloglomus salinum TaxID=2962673 RepID=UPI0020C9FBEF|nr:DUF5791 family protein [Haloglomus salinum]
MFHDVVPNPGELGPDELYERYVAELVAVIEGHGVETVAARSGVGTATLRALRDGESPELDHEDAVAILAVDADIDPDTAVQLDRDALLMGMTNAVLDVEALAAETDGALEGREIQSKVEGRFPMTLREFALLHATIQARGP